MSLDLCVQIGRAAQAQAFARHGQFEHSLQSVTDYLEKYFFVEKKRGVVCKRHADETLEKLKLARIS